MGITEMSKTELLIFCATVGTNQETGEVLSVAAACSTTDRAGTIRKMVANGVKGQKDSGQFAFHVIVCDLSRAGSTVFSGTARRESAEEFTKGKISMRAFFGNGKRASKGL